jgi:hypothetical protein
VLYAGNYYYPAGARIHFNENEMVRSGTYDGVPLYERTTIEPFSVVYVPLPGKMMRPYERRREGQLAGTVGSITPSFPVATSRDQAADAAAPPPMLEGAAPPMLGTPLVLDDAAPRTMHMADASGRDLPIETGKPGAVTREMMTAPAGGASTPVEAAPLPRRPESPNAIFIEYDNARWFSSGPAAPLDTTRLTRIGESHGFPVYRARRGNRSTIYMPIAEGMDVVAPFTKRNR